MNCKPGDIAVQVRASTLPQNLGKLYRVIERLPSASGVVWKCEALQPVDVYDWQSFRVVAISAGDWCSLNDSSLRPLRDSKGPDETIKWAGLPKPVYTPAPEWVK